jgi:hypothetical protein
MQKAIKPEPMEELGFVPVFPVLCCWSIVHSPPVGAVKAAVLRYAMQHTNKSPCAAPAGAPGVQLPLATVETVPRLTKLQTVIRISVKPKAD